MVTLMRVDYEVALAEFVDHHDVESDPHQRDAELVPGLETRAAKQVSVSLPIWCARPRP